jgi:hypothetical protein
MNVHGTLIFPTRFRRILPVDFNSSASKRRMTTGSDDGLREGAWVRERGTDNTGQIVAPGPYPDEWRVEIAWRTAIVCLAENLERIECRGAGATDGWAAPACPDTLRPGHADTLRSAAVPPPRFF